MSLNGSIESFILPLFKGIFDQCEDIGDVDYIAM